MFSLENTFGTSHPVIGVIHLLPLPGSPRYDGQLENVLRRAEQEAAALASGGAHGIIIENFFDAPFAKNKIDTAGACALTLAAARVKEISGLPLGINVLRNDGHTALAVAGSVGASFIRVNVFSGAMVTDQGIIESEAHELLLYRRLLGLEKEVSIFADVMVKHAAPLGPTDIGQAAKDTVFRGLADAIIVSGHSTGSAPDLNDLHCVRQAVPDSPILIGSGAAPENASSLLSIANGIIIASALKRHGKLENPVDPEKVRSFVESLKGATAR